MNQEMQSYVNGHVDIDSMWHSMVQTLLRVGIIGHDGIEARAGSGYMCRELLGTRWRLDNPCRNFLANETRKLCPRYASAELMWYLSRDRSIDMLLPFAPSYKRFAESDGTAHGAYGHRIATNVPDYDQLEYAVRRFKHDPNTRQMVITMWKPDDLVAADKKDVPCTVLWQFFIRHHALHMIAYMRSNDIWLGTPYDIYTFTCIQQMLAATLDIAVGTYTHVVGSLHMYERDYARLQNLEPAETLAHEWWPCTLRQADCAVAHIRRIMKQRSSLLEVPPSSCLSDTVSLMAGKFGHTLNIVSPALKKGLENVDSRRS